MKKCDVVSLLDKVSGQACMCAREIEFGRKSVRFARFCSVAQCARPIKDFRASEKKVTTNKR